MLFPLNILNEENCTHPMNVREENNAKDSGMFQRYDYDFTKPFWGRERKGPGDQSVQTNTSSEWWVRTPSGNYLPPVKLGALDTYLEHFGWNLPPTNKSNLRR